ncbi:hypothetical protein CCB80_12360 [Armatimonadetes bacterium Uphvl-Ar1]|nr:hypothetical protein CCB80_12360 [Armatimonadetes bacterium Uphvl-Ar1]
MEEMKLFYAPEGRLRLTKGNRSYTDVKLAWASPLSFPDRYLAFMNGKGHEIFMVTDPRAELPTDVWEVAMREIQRRYLNGVIEKIVDAKTEFGSTYWKVLTDRGQKEFITQSLSENAQWLSPTYLLLADVDGNRYEIQNTEVLDERSRALLTVTV